MTLFLGGMCICMCLDIYEFECFCFVIHYFILSVLGCHDYSTLQFNVDKVSTCYTTVDSTGLHRAVIMSVGFMIYTT